MAKTAAEATKGLKGKADDKKRPLPERLAHIEGRTNFTDPREPRGTWIEITDPDVMAALGMCRLSKIGENGNVVSDPADVGPEIMETYYGSTQRHRHRIAKQYMEQARTANRGDHGIAVMRAAALIAVQRIAGCQFSGAQWAELAWMAYTGKQAFMDECSAAMAWMYGELDRVLGSFYPRFREVQDGIASEKREDWKQLREDRLAGKRIPEALKP